MQREKSEILFLGSGPYGLDRREKNDKFKYFSKYYSCNLLTPVNPPTRKMIGLRETKVEDDFILIPFPYYYKDVIIRNLLSFYYIITKSLSLFFIKKRKFKVVISRNPMLTGLFAIVISKITGTKSIIEVNGDFGSAFKYGRLGEIKQSSNTSMLLFNVSQLISFISNVMTLMPGDIISTGTPSGIGPMKKGDKIEVHIEGIGILRNYIG